MKFGIISGSHRLNSQSHKVAKYISDSLTKSGDADSYLYSLEGNPLPLWDEGIWQGKAPWPELWHPVAKELQSCDGLIVVSPEWAGMVPPALKNFFLLCSNQELGHKPGLIVTISSSRNGAYPVAELKVSSAKNNHLVYIPEQVIVRDATNVLNDDTPANDTDTFIREKIAYGLKVLGQYGLAMKSIRDSGVIDYEKHGNGM